MVKKIYTVGVYGTREKGFFDKLIDNNIDTFVDVRIRRGMRGRKYSFVNSTYLQNKLNELGIRYIHLKELAPTKEVRELQKKEDAEKKVRKSERKILSDLYIKAYNENIISQTDIGKILHKIEGSNNIVMFCVEKEPFACHRSLAASFLEENLNVGVEHI